LTDLLLVPLEDTVVFPGMNVTLTVDVGDEDRVVLVPRHESEYAAVGTVAEVTDRVRIRGGGRAVSLEGLHRGVLGAAHSDSLGRLRAEVKEHEDENPPPVQTRELEREYRAVVEEILDLRDADDRVREFLRAITEAGALADTCAYAPDVTFAQRVELLETVDAV
jgi:ATP-dependent Lon protease